jgi:hypothetical protein
MFPLLRTLVVALLVFGLHPPQGLAQDDVFPLDSIPIETNTGEKPQSKVWFHSGGWWAVLPSSSPSGTWIWRLESDGSWTPVLRLSRSEDTKADALAMGDVTHVLLCDSSGSSCAGSPELVSVEYVPALHSYQLWSERPAPTPVRLRGSETSTIDVDTMGRMWIATTSGSDVDVHYSDPPYTSFSGPITLNPDDPISSDDISVVTMLSGGTLGVLWSNQQAERFGFRVHVDGAPPTQWSADEVPASQSARNVGAGMSDDHLSVALASDGTLYAAVKTSYDNSSYPKIALLVRRPGGSWDDLYEVDDAGTRPIVLLNEVSGTVQVVYTSVDSSSGGDIVLRESPLSRIRFGSVKTLMRRKLNNATSTKQNWTDEVVVLASQGGSAYGVLITRDHAADAGCRDAPWNDEGISVDVLLADDFASGTGPFHYRDDAFAGTSNPAHADGTYAPGAGLEGGALRVVVGAKSTAMSGGWTAPFQITGTPAEITVQVRYRLIMDGTYESDEHADVLLSVDGVLHGTPPDTHLLRFAGDGHNPSAEMDSCWRTHRSSPDLTDGSHELVIGVFNNKSTTSREVAELLIDKVAVTALGPECPEDLDGDGFTCAVDCDDADPAVHPGAADRCDGHDDDCDGAADEDFVPESCDSGQLGVCSAGTTWCVDGLEICVASAVPAADDAVCNGADDDCDGAVDEDFGAAVCDTGAPGLCAVGTSACAAGSLVCIADYLPAPFEVCDDGVDGDCDGFADCLDDECQGAANCAAMTLLTAAFDAGSDGFAFVRDAFLGTAEPGYADGEWVAAGGPDGSGALQVIVGGKDGDDIFGMSGGWRTSFTVGVRSDVVLTFHFDLTQTATYESDEFSQVLVSLDGILRGQGPGGALAQLEGDGDAGDPVSTGWEAIAVDLGTLSPGDHALTLGTYNNKKTHQTEWTTLAIDAVEITATPAGPAPELEVVLEAGFDTAEDGFVFFPDRFRGTDEPAYASGQRLSSGGSDGSGVLGVVLGGLDGDDILGMSGGWERVFHLDTEGEVSLSVRYHLTQASDYESDELSQALASVDGQLHGAGPQSALSQVTGNGNGGGPLTTGWQLVEIPLGLLAAGDHVLVLGGYNNKKTAPNESTEILFDHLKITHFE